MASDMWIQRAPSRVVAGMIAIGDPTSNVLLLQSCVVCCPYLHPREFPAEKLPAGHGTAPARTGIVAVPRKAGHAAVACDWRRLPAIMPSLGLSPACSMGKCHYGRAQMTGTDQLTREPEPGVFWMVPGASRDRSRCITVR